MPHVPPAPLRWLVAPALPAVRTVPLLQPLEWLTLGWRDMCRVPGWSFLHGLVLMWIGWIILGVGHNRFGWLVGTLSGFLVVGPVLATSLYALSRALERGEPVHAALLWRTWGLSSRAPAGTQRRRAVRRVMVFGLLLSLAATGWVLISAALISQYAPVRIRTVTDFLVHVVAAPDGQLFTLWMAWGTALAAPIFASSVVAIPLLLDRQVSVRQAVLTSWSVVLANPVPLALWAVLIVLFTLLGLASLLLGLVAVMPMLGHASWHAYRDTVDAGAFPPCP